LRASSAETTRRRVSASKSADRAIRTAPTSSRRPESNPNGGGEPGAEGKSTGTISRESVGSPSTGRRRLIQCDAVLALKPRWRQYSATVKPLSQYPANARRQRLHATPCFVIFESSNGLGG